MSLLPILVSASGLEMDQADDVGDQRRVIFPVERRLQIRHVAADAGEILPEVEQQAVGRVLVVVQRIEVERVADQRGQGRSARQFLADRKRRFAVAQTAGNSVESKVSGRIDAAQHLIDVSRRREETLTQRVARKQVVTIVQRGRQRDRGLVQRIAQLQRHILAQTEAEPRAEAHRLGVVRHVAVGQLLAIEQVETAGDAIIEQIGLDERQRAAARVLAVLDRRLCEHAAAEEIALGDAHLGQRAVGGRVAAGHREVAGGFLFQIHHQDHAVASKSRARCVIFTLLKKSRFFRRRSERSTSARL